MGRPGLCTTRSASLPRFSGSGRNLSIFLQRCRECRLLRYASHPEEDRNAYLARVSIPSPTSDVIYSTDIFWRIIHGFALRKKVADISFGYCNNDILPHAYIEASKNVIRIEYAARLIIQAYELGLEGKLQELDPRQRIAALVDLDLTKSSPKAQGNRGERKEGVRSGPMCPPALTRSPIRLPLRKADRAHIKLDGSRIIEIDRLGHLLEMHVSTTAVSPRARQTPTCAPLQWTGGPPSRVFLYLR